MPTVTVHCPITEYDGKPPVLHVVDGLRYLCFCLGALVLLLHDHATSRDIPEGHGTGQLSQRTIQSQNSIVYLSYCIR
jgi:hypothetical protein